MRSTLLCIVVLLFTLCPARAVAADSCSRFTVEVAAAANAYTDYSAYLKEGDSEGMSIAFKVLTHLLDVADEYAQHCDVAGHENAYQEYTRLQWYRDEYNYAKYGALVSEGKRVIANGQSSELKFLWALGFGKSNNAEFATMKNATESHFAELGLVFASPQTGKVLVKGNPSLAGCDRNDHLPGFDKVTLAYPEDALKAKLGGRFNINVLVDAQGKAETASARIVGPESVANDPNLFSLVSNVQNELTLEAQAVAWTPGVVGCRPMDQDYLMLTATLDPATGTVILERWRDSNP